MSRNFGPKTSFRKRASAADCSVARKETLVAVLCAEPVLRELYLFGKLFCAQLTQRGLSHFGYVQTVQL